MRRAFLGLGLGLFGLTAVATAGPDRRSESRGSGKGRPAATPDGGAPEAAAARPVRVRLLDGATVVGTVYAEEAEALVVECSLGRLTIPRARIASIFYDASGFGRSRAPVQMLDDADHPVPRAAKSVTKSKGEARPDE